MTHLELLAQFYLAYKSDDWEYAKRLQIAYPDVAAEVFDMVLQAETEQEFMDLVSDIAK